MFLLVSVFCCCVLGSIHQWGSITGGLWSDSSNWDPNHVPSIASSVLLPTQATLITITIASNVSISSLSLSSNVVLLFQNNSTLTISDVLLLKGGTLRTDLTSSSSFTSVDFLVLEGVNGLSSHKLIVNYLFDWKRGSIELDALSELMFVDVSNVTLEKSDEYSHPDLFLYYNWYSSFNTIDLSGRHDPNAIIIDGPQWKRDEAGGYMNITTDNTLHVPNLLGPAGWQHASISIWLWFEAGGMGFGSNAWPCIIQITPTLIRWGSGQFEVSLPLQKWFHLVLTFDHSSTYIYVDGIGNGPYGSLHSYSCSSDPSMVFPLSEIQPLGTQFEGKIRAVQFFTKTLTATEVSELHYKPPTGIHGQGKLSLVNSEVKMLSSKFDLRSITLTSSILQSNEATFDELQSLQLFNHSLVILNQGTTIVSETISITLNSSELYFDTSIEILSPMLSLIAVNSRFRNEFDFSNVHVLDLTFSTFESLYDFEIIVDYFRCSQCQIIGQSQFVIAEYSKIHSGNFSSSLIVQPSVTNSSVSGEVQLSDSFYFFSHVTFDDVSVSEFQSSSGSITCHSDVLMRNDVTFNLIQFLPTSLVVLSDSTVTMTSLTLVPNVVLFFQNNSTLTISDVLLLKGGTLRSDLSSSSSFTSVDSLVLEGDHTVLNSHKLIVNRLFDWKRGSIELDSLSELVFVDVINATLKSPDQYSHLNPFLFYSWHFSLNHIDLVGNHDLDAITIAGPEWKRDEQGGYLDVNPGNTLRVPNLLGPHGWRDASISIWLLIEDGGMGFWISSNNCRFYFRTVRVGWGR
ncbi:hypothetical protein GEMRC1_008347 [Eukaryota sp. GEM-RC1]